MVLDGDRDGIEQIGQELAGLSGLDAIHLITHGSQAELQLGTARLTLDSMVNGYADTLAEIGQALTSSADIELRAVAPSEGKLLAVVRITHTAGDRPASLPGTTAFQEAATAVAPEFFDRIVESWTQDGDR